MLSIAVIDDDVITLDMITEALESRLSATVYPFSRSQLAREFLLRQNASSLQLIICDQVMEGFDGLSLLKACHAAQLTIPFLMITADPNRALVMEARSLGVSGFLAKPLKMDDLIKKVKTVLSLNG